MVTFVFQCLLSWALNKKNNIGAFCSHCTKPKPHYMFDGGDNLSGSTKITQWQSCRRKRKTKYRSIFIFPS